MQSIETPAVDAATPTNGSGPGTMAAVGASALLAACGGGGDAADATSETANGTRHTAQSLANTVATPIDPFRVDAFRLLTQATFGPTPDEVTGLAAQIKTKGTQAAVASWVDAQLKLPRSIRTSTQSLNNYANVIQGYFNNAPYPDDRQLMAPPEYKRNWWPMTYHVSSAWWKQSLTAPDQLRQRVAFALSEVLVISMMSLRDFPFVCAHYYDLLLDGAFGSYRDLVTKVASHPAMGMYLSHQGNRRPDASGRIPDQNFARELMQLFTVGLYKLNMDGSLQLDASRKPQETYSSYDVQVLSHVFTGWSWNSGAGVQNAFYYSLRGELDQLESLQFQPMSPYSEHHSLKINYPLQTGKSVPTLLGKTLTVTEGLTAPVDNRKAALDIIFAHPNIAPFVAKQMIQRLVTSNPSTSYVGAAAKAFKDSNFNLGALVKAILTHPEACQSSTVRKNTSYGKLKEPLLRVTQFLRAFNASSKTFAVVDEQLPSFGGHGQTRLGQGPLTAPSVFNYFRPGYISPGGLMSKQGKVTPEMQICTETDLSRYAEVVQRIAFDGFGCWVDKTTGQLSVGNNTNSYSITCNYTTELDALKLAAAAGDPFAGLGGVIQSINDKLFGGTMSKGLREQLAKVAHKDYSFGSTLTLPSGTAAQELFFKNVLATVLFMATISPEYVVQR